MPVAVRSPHQDRAPLPPVRIGPRLPHTGRDEPHGQPASPCPPNNIIPAAGGKTVFLYTFADSKTGGLNLVIFNTRKTNVGVDTALIIFDKNGVVEQVNVSENSKDLEWDWWAFGS